MFIGSRTVLGAVCTSWMSCLLRPNRIQDTRVDTNKEAEFDDLQHLRDHYGCRKSRQGLVQVRHWDFILRWGRRLLGGLSKGEMSFNLELWSVILASVWEVEQPVRGWWLVVRVASITGHCAGEGALWGHEVQRWGIQPRGSPDGCRAGRKRRLWSCWVEVRQFSKNEKEEPV